MESPDLSNGVFQYHDLTRQDRPSSPPATLESNPQDLPVQNEPNQVPNPPNNTERPDTGGSQSEEQPDSEPENPGSSNVHPNPEQVPIPDGPFSDPEEEAILFCNQYDHWKIEDNSLVRYHVELRNRMFCPSNVTDCPVPFTDLSCEGWTITDTWKNDVTSQQILPMPWTGKTIIPLKTDEIANLTLHQPYQAYKDVKPSRVLRLP